jgi:undecaprenyl-diphosphatase
VTIVYRQRIVNLLLRWRERTERDYLLKLAVAFVVTAVLGLAAKLGGVELPETVEPVAWTLIGGGLVILLAEYFARHHVPAERVTWLVAIVVGMAQVLAGIFPGTSRSGAAIFAAMFAGLTLRARAAEFAFLVGIPTMFAAAGYELVAVLTDPVATERVRWIQLGVAFFVAAVTGFAAVKWLIGYISRHSFAVFAWYRIVFGSVLLVLA